MEVGRGGKDCGLLAAGRFMRGKEFGIAGLKPPLSLLLWLDKISNPSSPGLVSFQ